MQRLSKPQDRVMQWLGQGWEAVHTYGARVDVNGKRICGLDTLTVLQRLGLVEQSSRWHWRATDAGRAYWREKDASASDVTARQAGT